MSCKHKYVKMPANKSVVFIIMTYVMFGLGINVSFPQNIDQLKVQAKKHAENENQSQVAYYYNKIAYAYWENLGLDSAISYFTKSIEINRKIGNQNAIRIITANLAMIYSDKGNPEKALELFGENLKKSRANNNQNNIASDLVNMSNELMVMEKYNDVNKYLEEALKIAKEKNNIDLVTRCYGMLSDSYKKLGDSEKSIEYFNLYSALDKKQQREQIEQLESRTSSAEKEVTEKKKQIEDQIMTIEKTRDSLTISEQANRQKQLEIDLAKAQLEKQNSELKLREMEKRYFIGGLIFFIIVSVIITILFISKRKTNKLLVKQNAEILEQKKQIDRQNEKITESIFYAKNIQDAVLSVREGTNLPFESFIIFKPKDIVSGDFIWYAEITTKQGETNHIIAVADCIGHGVPGAFMSVIGYNILDELVKEKHIHQPEKILYHLNKRVFTILKPETTENAVGMDIAVCNIRKGEKNGSYHVNFSSANRPFLYFDAVNSNFSYEKGDKLSIADIHKVTQESTFTAKEFHLNEHDLIILFSDGIIDQSNLKNQRFGRKRFISCLQSNLNNDMKTIKNNLEQEYNKHKGNVKQRDDISVLGIRLS